MIKFSHLQTYRVHTTDGDIGHVKDCLFDDQDFVIRYLLVDTSNWLPLSRKVLISPVSVHKLDLSEPSIYLNLSRELVKQSPSIDEHKPVSREYEELLFQYFGYGYYWIGPGAWGDFAHPTELVDQSPLEATEIVSASVSANHLRSCKEIIGYDVKEKDNMLGHVDDFEFDTQTWALKDIVVDTSKGLSLGDPRKIEIQDCFNFDWPSHSVELSRAE